MNMLSKVNKNIRIKNYHNIQQSKTMTNKLSVELLKMSFFLIIFFSNVANINASGLNDSNPSPAKSDDHLVVVKNNRLIFDIVKKSTNSENITILNSPAYGRVFINNQDSMTYVPKADVCEQNDSFSYLLKTDKGFDTINVTIEIICETLTIISGFSPNGDGINDNFTILGVQNYPDNSLLIFNKWGEKIFHQKGYANNWNGEKDHGDSLPEEESLYYYVFNDGKGKSYSGYVKLSDQL